MQSYPYIVGSQAREFNATWTIGGCGERTVAALCDGSAHVEREERNVSLLNIVKLAHGLSVRPAKLIEPIH